MRKFQTLIVITIGMAAAALLLEAVVPRQWDIRTKDDFLKGKFDGLSVTFEGVLSLAPREEIVEGPAEDFYLSFLPGPDGAGFLGTGHGGKIYRVDKDGRAELYFQVQEMDVTCLALDTTGVLFAGTSPNGKIYKITGKDQGSSFFNPGTKYIWDLVFMDDGRLMAAVGEAGGIFKIGPGGEGQRVLKAEENHILCLHKAGRNELLAGSGGVGVIYRLGADGRATVLFESSYEEIKSLALDGEGDIYAACGGTPTRTKKEEETPAAPFRISTEVTVSASAQASTAARPPTASTPTTQEPGALIRVRPDGIAKKLWESEDELIYC
ncbi:MAG: WD40 repeat domain-containing protein, partial [Candidatus Aminicenantes bacterium]|nr:WD40 repeat domain-containing protein [Candidatus Aminicenantes bacterium]